MRIGLLFDITIQLYLHIIEVKRNFFKHVLMQVIPLQFALGSEQELPVKVRSQIHLHTMLTGSAFYSNVAFRTRGPRFQSGYLASKCLSSVHFISGQYVGVKRWGRRFLVAV